MVWKFSTKKNTRVCTHALTSEDEEKLTLYVGWITIGSSIRLVETQIGSVGGDALPLAPRDLTNNYTTTTMWTSSPKEMESKQRIWCIFCFSCSSWEILTWLALWACQLHIAHAHKWSQQEEHLKSLHMLLRWVQASSAFMESSQVKSTLNQMKPKKKKKKKPTILAGVFFWSLSYKKIRKKKKEKKIVAFTREN
jgi:hypothetical protein